MVPQTTQKASRLDNNQAVDAGSKIERQIGDGLSVLCLPAPLGPGSSSLVRKGMCSTPSLKFELNIILCDIAMAFITGPRHVSELSNVLDATGYATSMWVQYMFLDEACMCFVSEIELIHLNTVLTLNTDFHCTVAMSAAALNNLVVKPDGIAEAMRHLSQTFQLINKRLSGKDAISDATIAVVIGMAQFERHQGQYHRGIVHLNGLMRMVELRGGISSLTLHKPTLTQKLFRLDICSWELFSLRNSR
jgi:Fungal specific transcription factor domain